MTLVNKRFIKDPEWTSGLELARHDGAPGSIPGRSVYQRLISRIFTAGGSVASDCICLVIPKSRTVLGERAFSVAGPALWNSLPVSVDSVRCAQSLVSFRSRLKTYLFQIAYPP